MNKMTFNDEEVKISVTIPKKAGRLLANATLVLPTQFGLITIKGFQIWPSPHFNERLKTNINISPPSKPAFGRYFRLIYFEDEKGWFEIEKQIYEIYLAKKSRETYGEMNENVNPDDIPF